MMPMLPGLFFHLVKKGLVDEAAMAPLLERLPGEERFVATAVRGGEAFDSERWPVERDAVLARMAARRLPDPEGEIAAMLGAIEAAAGESAVLRGLARRAMARMLAAVGAEESTLLTMWRDATAEDRAVFGEPAWSAQTASDVLALAAATYEAADGLFAYHVHRGLPGPSADPAAQLCARAIQIGVLRVDELMAAAIGLVG